MILQIGQIIANRYQIQEQIGAGGMSIVYRALDTNLQRDVTFKVLREEYAADPAFIARFGIEARAVANLNHPNIVKAYDSGEEGDVRYIVLEYVPGKTLKELIMERAPFKNEVMLGVVSQIVAALAHAHENGVVHKDVKPQNILVSPNGDVKVTDFGIADSKNAIKIVDADSTMGSVHYISPEIACNDPADARSDLYSLGITIYEMMTNTLPFDSDNPDNIPKMHVEMPLPNIMKKNPEVLPLVREIVVKLTNKYPHQRYQSANSLQNDIQRAILECGKYREYEKGSGEPRYLPPVDEIPTGKPPKRRTEKAPKKPEDKKREMLILTGGIAVAVIVITGLIFGIIALLNLFADEDSGYVEIPTLVNRHIDQARAEMDALGLILEVVRQDHHETIPEGYIIYTNIERDGDVPVGTTIQVVVSLGTNMVIVPDFTEIHISQAAAMVLEMPIYVVLQGSIVDDNLPQDFIISQYPAPGTVVEPGSNVYVIYNEGGSVQMATAPNLQGMTETTARTTILSSGLNVGLVTVEESETVPRGQVIRQSVPPHQTRPVGTAIDFVISDGIIETADEPPTTDTPDTTPPADDDDDDENGNNNDDDNNDEGDDPDDQTTDDDQPAPPEPTITTRSLSLNPFLTEGTVYNLELRRELPGGGFAIVGNITATADQLPWVIQVQGYGTAVYALFVNNEFRGTEEVHFD